MTNSSPMLCPFGCKRDVNSTDEGGSASVYCQQCWCFGPMRATRRAAVEAWNTMAMAMKDKAE